MPFRNCILRFSVKHYPHLHRWRAAMITMLLIGAQPCISPAQDTAKEYYEEGLRLFEGCDPEGFVRATCDQAVDRLQKAIELDPSLRDAYITLAQAYWNLSFQTESRQERETLRQRSVELLHRLIEIDPTQADSYYKLSYRIGDPEERIDLLRKVTELEPKHPHAHRDLAMLLLPQGKPEEAVEEYKVHLEVSPHALARDARNNIFFADSITQAGYAGEAIEILEATLVEVQKQGRHHACRLFEPLDLRSYEAFKEFVEKVRTLRPYCTNLEHRNQAVRLMREGKEEEAIQELQLQLQINPYYEETYFLLSELYEKQGKIGEVLATWEKYFKVEPDPTIRCETFARLRSALVRRYKGSDKPFVQKLIKECNSKDGQEEGLGNQAAGSTFVYFFDVNGKFLKLRLDELAVDAYWALPRVHGVAQYLPPPPRGAHGHWRPEEFRCDSNLGRLYGVFPKVALDEVRDSVFQVIAFSHPSLEVVKAIELPPVLTTGPNILVSPDGSRLLVWFAYGDRGEQIMGGTITSIVETYDTKTFEKIASVRESMEREGFSYARFNNFFSEAAYFSADGTKIYDSYSGLRKLEVGDSDLLPEN